MSKDNIGFGGAGLNNPQPQPDIDDLLEEILSMVWNDGAELAGGAYLNAPHYGLAVAVPKLKHALYQRLAAEAVDYPLVTEDFGTPQVVGKEPAIPITKLKAIMEREDEPSNN